VCVGYDFLVDVVVCLGELHDVIVCCDRDVVHCRFVVLCHV